MNDMTLRMQIIQPLEDHSKQNLQQSRGYNIFSEPPFINPERFSQRLKNKPQMSSFWTIMLDHERIKKMSDKLPPLMPGVSLVDVSEYIQFCLGSGAFLRIAGIYLECDIFLIQPAPSA